MPKETVTDNSLQITLKIIEVLPSLFWYLIVLVIALLFYNPIKRLLHKLVDRTSDINSLKFAGIELNFFKKELEQAADKQGTKLDAVTEDTLKKRTDFVLSKYAPISILWIDDKLTYDIHEKNLLEGFKFIVHHAINSISAKEMMKKYKYQLVISDINREGNESEGIRFLNEVRQETFSSPFIFYTNEVKKELGTPPYSFGIADNPADLFHLVLDVVERI